MRYRTEADIEIMRMDEELVASVVGTVPITAAAKRTWRLMQEDSITLSFTLESPMELKVGDYIEDELFGKFRLRERAMPQYNKSTGGYDYTLRFDSHYWQWEKYLFMLTAVPKGGAETDRYRKESSWMLTAPLRDHALELARNAALLGIENFLAVQAQDVCNVCVRIHDDVKKASEVRFLTYNGVRICSALTQIANEYGCEWWVTVENGHDGCITPDVWHPGQYIVINFGKCEQGERLPLEIGRNVEEMQISRNTSEYADRLYVMGGTKNIPESYRKKIWLHPVKQSSSGTLVMADPYKTLQPEMMRGYTSRDEDGEIVFSPAVITDTIGTSGGTLSITFEAWVQTEGETAYKWNGMGLKMRFKADSGFGLVQGDIKMRLQFVGETNPDLVYISQTANLNFDGTPGSEVTKEVTVMATDGVKVSQGLHHVMLTYEYECDRQVTYYDSEYYGTLSKTGGYADGFEIGIVNTSGETCYFPAILNPLHIDTAQSESHYFTVPNDGQDTLLAEWLQKIIDGEDAECELTGVNPMEIPFSWYVTEDEDPSCVTSVGERRLMLPKETGGYLPPDNGSPYVTSALTEMVVVNDDIYPRCYLRVTDVTTEEREYKEELSDGSTNTWKQTVYVIKVSNINNAAFKFDRSYVRAGDKLQMLFLSEIDEQAAYEEYEIDRTPYLPGQNEVRCLLAGMTFDVNWSGYDTQKWTLVSNTDYGAKLPNDTLYPKVNDVLVLTGWDVKAMEELGLIDEAEQMLQDFGEEYLSALEEDQYTFECSMMSDWAWMIVDGNPLYDSGETPLYDNLQQRLYAVNGTVFRLPEMGQRVTVVHAALKSDKETRVIGYEFKLDIPYDTPRLTVGETEAYSRLKQLEKKITKM